MSADHRTLSGDFSIDVNKHNYLYGFNVFTL